MTKSNIASIICFVCIGVLNFLCSCDQGADEFSLAPEADFEFKLFETIPENEHHDLSKYNFVDAKPPYYSKFQKVGNLDGEIRCYLNNQRPDSLPDRWVIRLRFDSLTHQKALMFIKNKGGIILSNGVRESGLQNDSTSYCCSSIVAFSDTDHFYLFKLIEQVGDDYLEITYYPPFGSEWVSDGEPLMPGESPNFIPSSEVEPFNFQLFQTVPEDEHLDSSAYTYFPGHSPYFFKEQRFGNSIGEVRFSLDNLRPDSLPSSWVIRLPFDTLNYQRALSFIESHQVTILSNGVREAGTQIDGTAYCCRFIIALSQTNQFYLCDIAQEADKDYLEISYYPPLDPQWVYDPDQIPNDVIDPYATPWRKR